MRREAIRVFECEMTLKVVRMFAGRVTSLVREMFVERAMGCDGRRGGRKESREVGDKRIIEWTGVALCW